jgi:YesN/AraC family two-component response regulator
MNPNLVEMSLNEVESIKTFDDEILSNVLMGDRSMFGFLKGGKIVGAILDRLSDEYTSYLTKQDKTVKNNIKRDIEILKGEVKRKINMNINILNSYIPNKNNEEGLKNLIVKNELFLSGNNLEKLHDLLTNIKSRYEYVNERLSRLTDSGPSIKESIDIIENCKRILELVAKLDPEYLKTSENDSSGKDVDKDSLKNAVDEILQRYNNTEQSNNTRQVNTTTSNTSQNTTGDLDEGIKMINTIKTVLGVTNSTTQIPLLSRLINMMDDDVTKLNIESVLNKVKMDLNVYRKLLIGIPT